MTTLNKLTPGMTAVVTKVNGKDRLLRRHILEMGVTPGTEITLVKTAPLGDPLELKIRGYELTLRKKDAANIEITDIHKAESCPGRRPQSAEAAAAAKRRKQRAASETRRSRTRKQDSPLCFGR